MTSSALSTDGNVPQATSYKAAYRDVRCYVERREFPVVSIHGSYGAGRAGMFTAQLVVDKDPHFEDRTYVEFEYIDSSYPGIDANADNPAGKLLCEGEIRNYTMVSTAGSKQCIVTIVSTVVGHLSSATVTAANAKSKDMPLGISSRFSGATVLKDTKTLQRILLTPVKDNASPGLPGGIINLVRKGMHVDDKDASFLKAANQRLHIDQCINAAPEDKTTEIFLLMKETGKMLEDVMNGAAAAGGIPNVEVIKQLLLARVFYQNIYLPPGFISPEVNVDYRTYTQTQAFSGFKKVLKDKIDLCARIVDVSGKWPVQYVQGSPEQGLILTPSIMIGRVWVDIEAHLDDINFSKIEGEAASKWSNVQAHIQQGRAYLAQIMSNSAWAWVSDTAETAVNAVKGLVGHEELSAYGTLMEKSKEALSELTPTPNSVYSTGKALADAAGLALTKLSADIAEEQAKIDARKTLVEAYANELIAAYKALEEAEQSWSKHFKKGTAPPRYSGEVLLPELFFAVPPACNAILPSMYTQINIQHNMASTPTRLMLICPSRTGAGRFFRKHSTSYVVAPNIKGITGDPGKPLILEDAIAGKSVLLKHEKFSGPNPMIVPITSALGFAVNDIAELTKLGKRLKKLHGEKNDLDLVREIAHYRFFEQQIANNTGMAVMHEWIHLIPGLPCGLLVGGEHDPANAYTAKIEQIQFSIDKGRTSIAQVSFSHVMGLSEREDFMIQRRFYDKRVTPTNHIKDLIVAAGSAKSKRDAMAGYTAVATEAQKVLDKNKDAKNYSGATASNQHLANETANESQAVGTQETGVIYANTAIHTFNNAISELGISAAVPTFDQPEYDADANTGTPNQPASLKDAALDLFRQLNDIAGEFKVTNGSPVSLAYDALMHPTWLDNCFKPENIGAVYEYLFGVKSMFEHVPQRGSVAEIVASFLGSHRALGVHVVRPLVDILDFQQFRHKVSTIFGEASTPGATPSPDGSRDPVDPRSERGRIVDGVLARTRQFQFSELVKDADEAKLSKGVK